MIEIVEKGDVAVVYFQKKITGPVMNEFRDVSLSDLILEKTDCLKIVINMKDVEHLDSSALGRIIGVIKKFNDKGGAVALSNLYAEILNLMQMTRLDKIISIYDNEEEALKKLSS